MQKKYRRMLIMLVYILVVSSTIAYSALTSSLQLNAEAKLRTISDIRVTGISLSSANGGTLQYESSYDVNTITSGFVLPTTDSSITYKVTVTNNGTIDQTIYDILTQSSNNSGLYYEISGYNVRDVIGFKTVVEFYITYKTTTPSEEPINVVNKFNFKKVYHVTFEAKGGTSITDGIKYEGVDLDLSTFTSTKQGYILSGWTDEQDGTTIKYQTNGTYTLDRDLILYAVWEGNPNTNYSVNHYVHDLGTNTYTLDSTDNLTGTTDSTLTLASLKKTIPGFTYVDGYLTGGTTKPTSGAVTTTTVLADGSRVINLYYRRNYLYVQYHVNGGQLAEQHGSSATVINDLIASNNETTFLRGVYGSKVGGVNTSTYETSKGLHNYNAPAAINIEKNGYIGKNGQEWNTSSDGTGTSYDQDVVTYNANGFGGADLSTGDQVVTLYVNWVPVNYEIQYDLQGGTVSTVNPASYNIETATFTLNNPTQPGYTFTGWTGSNGETPETTVTIPVGSTGDKAYIANWQVNTYTVTADANGGSIPSTNGWTGTGNTATKSVTYDSQYGTLPTPTRDGYIFKGWNGKNLLDYNNLGSSAVAVGIEVDNNGNIRDSTPTSDSRGMNYKQSNWNMKLDLGTYTLSFLFSTPCTGQYGYYNIASPTTTIVPLKTNQNGSFFSSKFSLTSDTDIGISIKNYDGIYKVQLEEGTTSTPWEPYYVTNTVNVTQAKDHTLKAIWEAVNYEITYDLQGGTLSTTNPATYNIETNTFTLNNPTLTGYTFTGWTGSNGETPETTITISQGSTGDKAYIANWQANSYTVTADANGGTIATTSGWTGTGATSTKSVTYNNAYGTLPTISRTGYTFLGWNGKNLFNKDTTPYKSSHYIHGDGTEGSLGEFSIYQINVKPNTTYTITGNGGSINPGYVIYDSEGTRLAGENTNNRKVMTFTTPSSASYMRFSVVVSPSSYRYEKDIFQIEEGTTSTPWEPYYVTNTVNVTQTKDHTLKAIWELKESTLLPGRQFNVKIKQLAGNQDATHETANTNITSIVRSNSLTIMPTDDNVVSTSDSNTPTYAWFDSNTGTLYYYTDAVNIYMNSNSGDMFRDLKELISLNLSNFNTEKVSNMSTIFYNCLKLSSLNISNFNTSNVENMSYMFCNCKELVTLDLSNFDTSKMTYATQMLAYMTSLKSLKTPSTYPTDSSKKIILPKTMIDASGNEYTELDNTSPTETILYTRSIFLPGNEFNAKIKQLAGNQDATINTPDRNITSIVRSNTLSITPTSANIVSTSDSYYPIYAWFNNGTLYYYSESQEIYMNSYAYAMFRDLTKAVSIDLSGISTKLTTEMSAMFLYDDKLATLDLSNFDTSNVRQMQSMFHSCTSLQELDLSSFDLTSITNSGTMFNGMTSLKRLKTPEVIPSGKTVVLSKLLVDASGNEYTELNSTTPTETWLYVPATFSSGTEFNAKIKQLAGNNGATYETENTNITSIVRTNTLSITPTSSNIVSTSDSYYPIYAWYNNGVIYYYSEANNLYMNKTATRMFTNLKSVTGIDLSTISTVKSTIFYELFYNDINLETIDVSHFNTSNVTDMQRMFRNCSKIEALNLSNFNTAKVTDMRMMFSGCSSLETLNISSFRTPNVVYMNGMFTYTKLQTLDLSNFDMTKVTNTTDMLRDMSELEQFKTPNIYPSEAVIQMPQTLYDTSGNSWTVLDSSAPTETWLKLEYIPYSISYNLDGGAVSTANPTSYNINSSAITLNNPTRSGYAFAGWSGGKNIQTIPTIYATVTEARNTTIDQMFFIKAGTYTYTRNVDGVSSLRDAIILKDLNGNDLSDSSYSPNNSYYYNTSYKAWIIGTDSTGSTLSRTITIKEDCYIKFVVMFSGSSNTKIISQLEEGTTSTYVDKQTTVTIPTSSTGNRVYTANWTANNYTVTAEANGGSIPATTGWTGTGNTATKSVTYNSSYGTLPEPTRTGYTFKGWNGKNLLNIDKMTNDALINNNDGTYTIWYKSTGRYGEYFDVDIPENTKLIMNYELLEYNGTYPAPLQIVGIGDGNAFYIYDKNSVKNVNINISKIRIYQEGTQPIGTYTKFKNLQLEEGATATPYEPYYVTSSTNVTQDKNHTLKAIWEMDTYEITYDLQGGTLASSNPATYNVETNTFTLNNPTLTGQTFIGWTGSNGNTPEVNVTIPVGSTGDKAYVAHFSPIYEPETRIRSLNTIGTSIADDDPDSNLRFIGANPNNYVSFNGQKWRIIGVFDGKLKIIGDSIGKYSWDTSRNTVNNGYGINQWGPSGTYTGADLMKLLNPGYSSNTDLKCNNTYSDGNCGTNDDSDYTTGLVNNSLWWNAQSGYCYNWANYSTTACDFTNTGLKTDTARNMIDNATWYLGSNLASDNIWDGRMTASYLYNIERSNNTGKQCQGGNTCNDDVTRTTTWQGKVGLLYPSDYAYATSGGTTHNRNTCLTVSSGYSEDNSVQNWDNTYTDCKNNNWIVDTSQWTWFISPRPTISYSYGVFFMYYTSSIRSNPAFAAGSVRPVVYLKSSVKFTSGDGSYNSPFNLIDTE